MPERAELRLMREEMGRRGLALAKMSTPLPYPFCQLRLLFPGRLVSAEAQSFSLERGRRLLRSHPILVARGQAAPASGPRGYCARNPTPKVGAIPHPRAPSAVHQRGLLGCPVLLIATALGSGSPECNHTGSVGQENPDGLCKPHSALIGSTALVRSLRKLNPPPTRTALCSCWALGAPSQAQVRALGSALPPTFCSFSVLPPWRGPRDLPSKIKLL